MAEGLALNLRLRRNYRANNQKRPRNTARSDTYTRATASAIINYFSEYTNVQRASIVHSTEAPAIDVVDARGANTTVGGADAAEMLTQDFITVACVRRIYPREGGSVR